MNIIKTMPFYGVTVSTTSSISQEEANRIAMDVLSTPWGRADNVEVVAPGIVNVGTPSHGGVHLDAERNRRMPKWFRQNDGWYEEDIDANAPMLIFFKEFDAFQKEKGSKYHGKKLLELIIKTLKEWRPDEYGDYSGHPVALEDSSILRKRAFFRENEGRFITTFACGDWHEAVPEGFVGIGAMMHRIDGRPYGKPKHALVPDSRYRNREFGYVVADDDIETDGNFVPISNDGESISAASQGRG